jgi:hypothetical protein
MASRQRQLVFLTRAARRYNGPDGSASTRLGPIRIGGTVLWLVGLLVKRGDLDQAIDVLCTRSCTRPCGPDRIVGGTR